jgi:hypothetical protein
MLRSKDTAECGCGNTECGQCFPWPNEPKENASMQTWEVAADNGKVALTIGDTKGGLGILHVEAELIMTPFDARDLAEELMRIAEALENNDVPKDQFGVPIKF